MGAIALPLLKRPLQPVGVKWDDPLADGLLVALPLTEPGCAARSLVYGDIFTCAHGGAGGKLSSIVQAQHADYCNSFGSGYAFAMWMSGANLSSWSALFSVSDSTITWQRYSSSGYFKNYHNGTGRSFPALLVSEVSSPQCFVGVWHGGYADFFAYSDGVLVADEPMAVTPKTDSTSSVIGFHGGQTIYQAMLWNRPLTQEEAERLTYDPFGLYEVFRGRSFVALVASGITHELASSIAAAASVTGALSVTRSLAGDATGQANVTGDVQVVRSLAGSATTQAAASGSLRTTKPLAGSSAGSSGVSAGLAVNRSLAGSVAGQTSVAGAVSVQGQVSLTGAVTAQAGTSGSLRVTKPMAGSSAGTSGALAALAVNRSLAGSVAGQASMAGAVFVQGKVSLAGAVTAQAGASGSLRAAKRMAGSSGGSSGVSAALVANRSLVGSVAGQANVTGGTRVARSLAGEVASVAAVAGDIKVARPLAGQVLAESSTAGGVRVTWSLGGTVGAVADLAGLMLNGRESWVPVAGSIQALATMAAVLRIFRIPTGQAAVLQSMMQADANAVLDDLPAESAVYQPAGGDSRPILIVVDRQAPHLEDNPRRQARPLRVWAKNDASGGIGSAEVSHRDTIMVARHYGATPVSMRVIRRLSQNDGWTELEVL